tara:strand:+ start:212 stop:835 length:624 start_codon:yes stop_codon:yes gene_type:complete
MTYSELVTQIKNFLEDDSTEFVGSIDAIIVQVEEMIFQRAPNLPCYRGTTAGNTVAGTVSYVIPTARMIRNFQITIGNNVTYLDHRIDSYLRDYWPNPAETGVPKFYSTNSAAVAGTSINLAPTPDIIYAFVADYIAPETGLSSGNPTTWISTNAVNVLLSGCLYEASAFLKAPETLSLYKTQFDEAIAMLQEEMKRIYAAEYNGGI